MKIPTIAIIGRPNVGKSTIFNCFAKKRRSIVSDIPGTTRDNITEKVNGESFDYWLIDTAGLRNDFGDSLENEIQMQADLAMKNADLILFIIDGKSPITLEDQDIVVRLRKSRTPFLFIANKIDDGQTDHLLELSKFGFGLPLSISAKNYVGVMELEDSLEEKLEEIGFEKKDPEHVDEDDSTIKVSFIGRPNVGKSSLFNSLLGEKKAIVSEIAGTTRDSIDSEFIDETNQKFIFLDTAGLKRAGRIGKDIDFWSSVRTERALESSDVCIILIDALDGVTHQDLVLAGKAVDNGKCVIIGVNKFDLAREKSRTDDETDERDLSDVKMWGEELEKIRNNYLQYLKKKISFLPWASVLFFSAKTGKGVSSILESVKNSFKESKKRISTAELNKFVPEVYHAHVQPMIGTKKGTIKYASQVDTSPPKFVFFVNNTQAFHFSYKRYLENKLREKYGFFGTPIIVEIRDSMKDQKRRKK